jgi:Transposase IS66 family
MDTNTVERAMRPVALGPKAWLFAGSDRGGERAAAMYSLIVTAKLNDIDRDCPESGGITGPSPDYDRPQGVRVRIRSRPISASSPRREIIHRPNAAFAMAA